MAAEVNCKRVAEFFQSIVQPIVDVIVVRIPLELCIEVVRLLRQQRLLLGIVELNGLDGHSFCYGAVAKFSGTLLFALRAFGILDGAFFVCFGAYPLTIGNLRVFTRPSFIGNSHPPLNFSNPALLDGGLPLFLCQSLLLKRICFLLFRDTLLVQRVFSLSFRLAPRTIGFYNFYSKSLCISDRLGLFEECKHEREERDECQGTEYQRHNASCLEFSLLPKLFNTLFGLPFLFGILQENHRALEGWIVSPTPNDARVIFFLPVECELQVRRTPKAGLSNLVHRCRFRQPDIDLCSFRFVFYPAL